MKLQDIFGRLTHSSLSAKYGSNEIAKIKTFILNGQVNIAQSLSQLRETNLPAYSIHLQGDTEDENKAMMNDVAGEESIAIDPEVIVSTFNATSYDQKTGYVRVPDSVDLSNVYKNRYFVDGMGQEIKILDNISNDIGNKFFTIATNLINLDLNNCTIISAINERIFELKMIPANETIMIGAHSENALFTKYLYYILRYILRRYKYKFHEFGMELSKYNGSDFSLHETLMPEAVYSRFITTNFITYDCWKEEEKLLIDNSGNERTMIESFEILSYDPFTGFVNVPNTVDLSNIAKYDVLVDIDGNVYEILGGISNIEDNKGFNILRGRNIIAGTGYSIIRYYKLRVPNDGFDRDDANIMTWNNEKDE
jgi:hypothetical protein